MESLLLFSPLFKKHRMITYLMPDTVLGTKDNTLNQGKRKRMPLVLELSFLWREKDSHLIEIDT